MNAVIFGGGKIARGFIAHLLSRSGFHITFVEVNEDLVKALNKEGRYYVNVMGNPQKSQWVTDFTCIWLQDIAGIARVLEKADIAFTSVGGKNLNDLAGVIGKAYQFMDEEALQHEFTIVTCENWKEPGRQLKSSILKALEGSNRREAFEARIGISEAVIMRSGVEATKEVKQIDVNAEIGRASCRERV